MRFVKNISVSALVFIFLSCSLEPEPINYGKDLCAHCNMKIMDKRYGAELLNSKGKVFKFDSGECLIDYISQNNIPVSDIGLTLVTDFNNPGNLITTKSAGFLISQKLPSPMGAFLTAFSSQAEAKKKSEETGGEVYTWDSVRQKLPGK